MKTPISCDIFCAVIDNLGDAGVCWRLARQLASEYGWRVRVWIDAPALIPQFAPEPAASGSGVDVCLWIGDFTAVEPAQVVIEAFACALPARYVAALAALPHPAVWLNLEYLSAEDWVVGCHALPSPHPHRPLTKFFFFPGFVAGTAGLLRERNFAVPPAPTFDGPLHISLFCYDNPALPALLDSWRAGTQSTPQIICHVADGLPQQQVATWLDAPFRPGAVIHSGQLTLRALPFLSQTGYDNLLAACQLNFVRGEDSLIRAMWAERAFVWQAYPQAGNTHLLKLSALLKHYSNGLDAEHATAVCDAWQAWNDNGARASAWPAMRRALPALSRHAPTWAHRITAHGDLATNLVTFCSARL